MLAILCMTGMRNGIAQLNYDHIYKYAGSGTGGPSVNPSGGLAVDKYGNVYMGENNRIVKIDAITGLTSVVAGTGAPGFSGDGGLAISAQVSGVLDIAINLKTDELYFVDQYVGGGPGGLGSGNRVRKISSGLITTVAGTGTIGHSGDGGSPTAANISARAVTITPMGNLLIAEPFYIREVNGGMINTIAGRGASPYSTSGSGGNALYANIDLGEGQIECDAYGNIYISESPWNIIRKIDPVSYGIAIYAGTQSATRGALGAYLGDGGSATAAQLFNPLDFVFDSFGNMYIGDSFNFVVRKVTPGGAISTIAGNNMNTFASLPDACGHPKSIPIGVIRRVAIDPDNCVYMFNSQIPVIWKISEGLKIKNIDINTLCAPGTPGASVTPKLTAYVIGGVAPYNCYWTPLPGNNVSLNNHAILSPEITGVGAGGSGKVLFELLLEDNAGCYSGTSRKTNFSLNSSLTFDLAMRDSYLDMYDEPNSQNFEHSPWDPDIWNRVFPDDRVNVNQDPCFGGGSAMCNNHMYVTVRNVGCVASPAGKQVKMYWTAGGTEQKWPGNWTTDIYPGTSLPQGKEIAVITLPSMPAGSKQEFKQAWTAPDPVAYTGASNMGICFQGRIVDGHHGGNKDGMSFEESEHVFRNMEYNNNIVLRNSKVVRIYHLPGRKLTVLTGNVESTSRVSSLSFSNRDITVSTLSQYAEITVYLGDIYDLWVAGGSLGIYQQTNPAAKTVTFNGTNEVRLEGILFPANYQYPVDIEFTLKPGVDGTEMRTEYVYFQQFSNTQQGPKMHGSFEFIITYDGEAAPAGAYRAEGTNNVEQPVKVLRDVKVFPNPASATVNFEFPSVAENGTIVLVDVSGHVVAEQTLKNQKTSNFDVRSLAPGVYIYKISVADITQSGTVIVEK